MKVLILNNDFPVYWKGRIIYLQELLASHKINFLALELFGKGSPYSPDTSNRSEEWWSCLFPHNSSDELKKKRIKRALFDRLDQIDPDIIIASSIVFYAGALGICWTRKRKKKFIMFDDASPLQVKRNFLVQWIKNVITQQADGLWFPSEEYYKEYPYFHDKKIHFFYGFNCVDNAHFKNNKEKVAGTKTIMCVARLVPIKNIDNLLKAWYFIEQQHTGYKLVIIGSGSEYEKLERLKTDLQLNTAEFYGGIDYAAIPEHFYKADAFILPSLSESWGLAVNEAMAAGLPVLLSYKINAAKILLKEGINGFGFNPSIVANITSAILKYINLHQEAKALMSFNSLDSIKDLSYENMGLKLTEALVIIKKQPDKTPGLLASSLINLWKGKYNKTVWNEL